MSARCTAALLIALAAAALPAAEVVQRLPDFAVSADRRPRAVEEPVRGRGFDAAALQDATAVDRALRMDPAFSLFRRTDSLAANPTAQGVSLRGIGPSGASRSLVLLDGVPLNDPFGGWVPWTQLPTLALAGAEVRTGGGSAAWGNAALGGVIALVTTPPAERRVGLRATAGSFRTRTLEGTAGGGEGALAVSADVRWFETDGFHPLRAEARGPVDRTLAGLHRLAGVAAARRIGEVEARLTLRHFTEERTNGTALQRNATRINSAVLTLAGSWPEGAWQAAAYGQSQTFRSFFSAVNPARTLETPANDQFDVPAAAAGAGTTFTWTQAGLDWSAGADVRAVRGETREDYLFNGTTLTRRRVAGGRQFFAGAFFGAGGNVTDGWRIDARLRADHWALTDGRRREMDRATGSVVRDDRLADRSDTEWTAQVEAAWRIAPAWTGRGSLYSAFRVPTLNELHRPFRVGNTATEANPLLQPETLRGFDLGLEHRRGRLESALTLYGNALHDAVGNVTLASTPALVSRQRRNLDRVHVRGLEARAGWEPARAWRIEGGLAWSDARVRSAAVQPQLAGRRLAQVPRLTATAALRWQPARDWEIRADGRWSSMQFEDDENQLRLGAAGVIDLALRHQLNPRLGVLLQADNLLDAAVETARSPNGPTAYAAPRSVTLRLTLAL